jgi:hypothetical protein
MGEITRSPLCWPDNAPRTIPSHRRQPLFVEQSISYSLHHLKSEINRLNKRRWDYQDESLIISTNLDLRLDGIPRSNQGEPNDTGAAAYFSLRFSRNGKEYNRHVVLTCDRWCKVAFNLTAIAKDIEAQRARERWGCTTVEQAFQGYLAIPERCGGLAWWDLLGVKPDVAQQDIKGAFRLLAKTRHPDVGGDRAEWNKLQEAYDQALARFRNGGPQ